MRPRALLPLALAPLGALAYAFAKGSEEPERSPRAFRARGRRPGTRVIALLGASLLHGKVSFDAIELLAARLGPRFDLINAGRNGDLAYNARLRLSGVLACEPDDLVVLVGTNDVLATLSPSSTRLYRAWKELPEAPTLGFYRRNLEGIVERARASSKARIALASLPPIGEALDDDANAKIHAYNEVVREVARANGAAYLKVHERLAGELVDAKRDAGAPLRLQAKMLSAVVERYLARRSWDDIARGNGLLLSTDGVHLNQRGAELLADVLAEHLIG